MVIRFIIDCWKSSSDDSDEVDKEEIKIKSLGEIFFKKQIYMCKI